MGNSMEFPQELKLELPYDPEVLPLNLFFQRKGNQN
jgi:hypothetical protein